MSTPVTEEDILQAMRRYFSILSNAPIGSVIPSDPTDESPILLESYVVVKVTTFARMVGMGERVRSWDSGTSVLTEQVIGLRESIVRFFAFGDSAVEWIREFDNSLGSTLSIEWLNVPIVADSPAVTIDRIGIGYNGSIISTSAKDGTSYQKRAIRDLTVSHGSYTERVTDYVDKVSIDITLTEEGGSITQTVVAP